MPPLFSSFADKLEVIVKTSASTILLQSEMGIVPPGTRTDAPPAPAAVPAPANNAAQPTPAVLSKAQLKWNERFRMLHGIHSDEDTLRLAAAFKDRAENIQSRLAPKTISNQERIKAFWEFSINAFRPTYDQVPQQNLWLPDMVINNMFNFLPTMLDMTPHEKVIFDRNLSRTLNKKHYFGRAEVQQILSTMLDASAGSGPHRLMNLQFGLAILIVDYATTRPCGLAAASHWLAQRGQYLKLKDFSLYSRGPMNWEIQIHMTYFKGALNTAVADEQTIVLKSVGKAHNALFDPTLWAVSYWFARGVFQQDYHTLEEICNDKSAQIQFKASKLDEPAFVAGKPGGFGLTDPPVPQTSAQLSNNFSSWSKEAGLPQSGMYALRREAGNMYALQLGTEAAKDIMNHSTTGVFRRHYSKNAQNFDLVGLRNGEVTGNMESFPGQVLKTQNERTLFLSAAVENMVRFKAKAEKPKDRRQEALAEEAEYQRLYHNDPAVTELSEKADGLFQEFLTCMTSDAKTYENTTFQVNRLLRQATQETKDKGFPSILPGCDIKARETHGALIRLLSTLTDAKSKIRRIAKRGIGQANNQSFASGSLSGTTAEREQAIKDVSKPSDQLLAAAQTASTSNQTDDIVFCGNNAEIGTWKASLDQAIYEDEDEDQILREEVCQPAVQGQLNSLKAHIELDCPVDDSNVSVPSVNLEEDEADILNIPLPDLKFALLQQYLNPIFRDRMMVTRK
ncbi:hypothetical protein BJ912DRAFT_960313, partial [Pholiota molesta]